MWCLVEPNTLYGFQAISGSRVTHQPVGPEDMTTIIMEIMNTASCRLVVPKRRDTVGNESTL